MYSKVTISDWHISACKGTWLHKLIIYITKKYMYTYDLRVCSLCFVSSADWRKASAHLFLTCVCVRVCVCVCVWFCVPKADIMQVNTGCSIFFLLDRYVPAGHSSELINLIITAIVCLALVIDCEASPTRGVWRNTGIDSGEAMDRLLSVKQKKKPRISCYLMLHCL